MDKQQTALEWLIDQTRLPEWHSLKRGEILDQAKEMEKTQIIDAYNQGCRDGEMEVEKFEGDIANFSDAKLYYERNYK